MTEYKCAARLEHFQTGIFAALTARREALQRAGKKLYNLYIGTPDFPPAPHVVQALAEAAQKPENYKYALIDLPELLEAVAGYYKTRFGVEVRPEQILSVNGLQEGIGHLGLALCDPGDVVLLPDPGYPIFETGAYLGGAAPYFYPLLRANRFLPDLSAVPEEVLHKTKYMVVSYPSNPVGAAAPASMYEELIAYAKKYHFIIVNDNAYSDILFDGREGISFYPCPARRRWAWSFSPCPSPSTSQAAGFPSVSATGRL